MLKSPLVIISITIAGLLVLAGASYFLGYFNFNIPPPPEPPPQGTPAEPPPPRESELPTRQPAPGVKEKIESLGQAIADVSTTGESKEVTLVFTEAEINEQASILLAQIEMPEDIRLEVKSVHIDLQTDNKLVTEVETVAYGFEVTIKVKAQVGIKEGKPGVEITDINFGFIPLPGTVKDRITALITQNTDDLLVYLTESEIGGGKVDFEFKDINIQQKEITIAIIIKPKV